MMDLLRTISLACTLFICAWGHTALSDDRKPQDDFWEASLQLCGRTLPGLVHEGPAGDDFSSVKLSVARCRPGVVEADLIVNGRVREIWALVKRSDGLDLRHLDFALGEDRAISYGGATEGRGSSVEQLFPADEVTKSLGVAFRTNVWRLRFTNDSKFIYRLDRATKSPLFELRFDLSE